MMMLEEDDKKPEDDEDDGMSDDGDEDGGEGEDGEEGAGGKKKPDVKKLALFIGVPIILLLAIGGGLFATGMLDGLLGKHQMEDGAAAEDGEHGAADEAADHGVGAHFLEIPNMVVNLASTDGQPRYLRLSIQLELDSEEEVKAVEAVLPRVVDQFQTYLRELRVKDLKGSAGIYRLQMELLSRVNAAAYPVKVRDVLFQEILIQ